MNILKRTILILALIITGNIFAQINYNGINIQGQFLSNNDNNASVDLDVLILNTTGDTLRHERHENITLGDQKSFNFILGDGLFINGQILNFNQINWELVDVIKINHYHPINSYEIGSYNMQSVPYALHSLSTITIPPVSDLIDTPVATSTLNSVLKYDGVEFIEGIDLHNDSIIFTWYSNQVYFSDTVQFWTNTLFSDTSIYSLISDTTLYTQQSQSSSYADSSIYSDSTGIALFSSGNWGLNGNTINGNNSYIGTNTSDDLILATNNAPRLTLSNNNSIYNSTANNGFNLDNESGALFTTFSGNYLTSIPYSHLYFNGENSSFHGGSSVSNLDSMRGAYSFVWGENSGTNGRYSTVFGKNSYGDSSATYDSYSSFACGKNCITTRTGVAIGENAIAGKYRNIAIGKNVFSGTNNASIGIGDNVLSTGATAWAIGNNVTASGHYSTALGTNSNTNALSGSFVYGDFSTTDTIYNTSSNEFIARASGGFVFYTSSDLSMGVELLAGAGSWNMISDRSKKENIMPINYNITDFNLRKTPVYSWTYKDEKTIHLGPMAQDFNSTFKTGETPNYINMIDIDGVILMGIKKTHETSKKQTKIKEISKFEEAINKENKKLEEIELQIKLLYEKLDN